MKVSVNLNDMVRVKLTNLGALKYNARMTKGLNQEELNSFYSSNKTKNEGDYIEGNLYLIIQLFSTELGDLLKDCFYNEEFEVVTNY